MRHVANLFMWVLFLNLTWATPARAAGVDDIVRNLRLVLEWKAGDLPKQKQILSYGPPENLRAALELLAAEKKKGPEFELLGDAFIASLESGGLEPVRQLIQQSANPFSPKAVLRFRNLLARAEATPLYFRRLPTGEKAALVPRLLLDDDFDLSALAVARLGTIEELKEVLTTLAKSGDGKRARAAARAFMLLEYDFGGDARIIYYFTSPELHKTLKEETVALIRKRLLAGEFSRGPYETLNADQKEDLLKLLLADRNSQRATRSARRLYADPRNLIVGIERLLAREITTTIRQNASQLYCELVGQLEPKGDEKLVQFILNPENPSLVLAARRVIRSRIIERTISESRLHANLDAGKKKKIVAALITVDDADDLVPAIRAIARLGDPNSLVATLSEIQTESPLTNQAIKLATDLLQSDDFVCPLETAGGA